MEISTKNLIQYIFYPDEEGFEIIATPRGKIISVKTNKTDYLLDKSFLPRYIQGSTPILYSNKFSSEPKENELLIIGRTILRLCPCILKDNKIKIINKNFHFPSESKLAKIIEK